MEHIKTKMENLDRTANNSTSILETILKKTKDPKIAAVLALDLILVGVDTASVATTTIICQLAQNLEKQEILHQELKGVLTDKNSKLNFGMFEQLPYLKACIKEGLR